jgi:hypothetical protein
MSQNLAILATVEDEWAFVLTETNVFDFSDIQIVISSGVYIYRARNNLSKRPIQKGCSLTAIERQLQSIARASSEVHAQRSLAFGEEVDPIGHAVPNPFVEAGTGSN